jgi:ABC-2 type transport system permease protein
MYKLLSLIKTDLNITFGLSSIIYSFKARKQRWQIIVFGIAMLSLIPTYIMMIKALVVLYDAFGQMGQQSYFLLMGFLGSQLIVFFFGLLYVMSKYYFSNDLNHLLQLPIKPSYILTSKFITIMVSEYITSLPIFLSFIFIYGINGKEGFLFWLYSLLATITLPILPLVLASIVIMIMMKYTNIKGKRDLIRTISGIVFIIVVLYAQLKFQQFAQKSILQGDDFYFNLARDANLLVRKLGIVFPPSMWGALSLANYDKFIGFTNILMFVLSGIAGFILMIFLSEKIFFDGLIGNIEVTASKGKGKKQNLEKTSSVTKPYLAIAKKELKMLFKTPVYLMNSVGGVIIAPIIIVMSMATGDTSMDPLKELINKNIDIVNLAAIAMIGTLGILNSIGTTTFSREGKNFWIQRTLPIKAEDQVYGRIIASMAIQIIGAIVLIGSLFFIIRLDLTNILLILSIGLLASIPMTEIGMIIDILRPMLTWSNPQQAMKQNMNVLIGMGVAVIYGGALFLIVRFMYLNMGIWKVYLILTTVLLISTIIFFKVLKTLIEKQFRELE